MATPNTAGIPAPPSLPGRGGGDDDEEESRRTPCEAIASAFPKAIRGFFLFFGWIIISLAIACSGISLATLASFEEDPVTACLKWRGSLLVISIPGLVNAFYNLVKLCTRERASRSKRHRQGRKKEPIREALQLSHKDPRSPRWRFIGPTLWVLCDAAATSVGVAGFVTLLLPATTAPSWTLCAVVVVFPVGNAVSRFLLSLLRYCLARSRENRRRRKCAILGRTITLLVYVACITAFHVVQHKFYTQAMHWAIPDALYYTSLGALIFMSFFLGMTELGLPSVLARLVRASKPSYWASSRKKPCCCLSPFLLPLSFILADIHQTRRYTYGFIRSLLVLAGTIGVSFLFRQYNPVLTGGACSPEPWLFPFFSSLTSSKDMTSTFQIASWVNVSTAIGASCLLWLMANIKLQRVGFAVPLFIWPFVFWGAIYWDPFHWLSPDLRMEPPTFWWSIATMSVMWIAEVGVLWLCLRAPSSNCAFISVDGIPLARNPDSALGQNEGTRPVPRSNNKQRVSGALHCNELLF